MEVASACWRRRCGKRFKPGRRMRPRASGWATAFTACAGKAGQYIIRIRIPAGVLTTDQLETVAALTEQSGWEAGAHLTTRQGIEIAGLPAVEIPAALEQLEDAGLTTLRTGGPFVRGVVACPFSGVARDEIFDVTPFALAVDRYFREHADFQKLPRKIKISFDGCAHDHVRTLVSDIGVRAVRQDGAKRISHHHRRRAWCLAENRTGAGRIRAG